MAVTVRRRFTVFGSSRVADDGLFARQAAAVGRILAQRGITVVSGGYDGVMGAASRGAAEAGGQAVGVLTPTFSERSPNPHLSEIWTEPDYLARLSTLCRQADGFVALGGALGTLSEWTTVWCLASIGATKGPLFLFEDPWRPLVDAIATLDELDPRQLERLRWLSTPDDLAAALDA